MRFMKMWKICLSLKLRSMENLFFSKPKIRIIFKSPSSFPSSQSKILWMLLAQDLILVSLVELRSVPWLCRKQMVLHRNQISWGNSGRCQKRRDNVTCRRILLVSIPLIYWEDRVWLLSVKKTLFMNKLRRPLWWVAISSIRAYLLRRNLVIHQKKLRKHKLLHLPSKWATKENLQVLVNINFPLSLKKMMNIMKKTSKM